MSTSGSGGERFEGKIGRTFRESEPWWPPLRTAAQDRPNVVVILFDDLGFAHLGCYGSTISTPNIDRLAAGGLRFTNFHVTPLCSPTRASLLTGRNHHTVGMRAIAHFDSGYPHMRSAISQNAATMAEVLRDENYATYAVGKWHLTPLEASSQAGPFEHWPLQRGFDRFYGFLGGETDQFYPELVYDNHHVDPPKRPEEGYHLTEDLADHAVGFLRDQQSVYPGQPFFLYFTPGATHSPHQAPAEYIEKYRGKFDIGWDEIREQWFARQLELGVIPEGTELAPRNPGVKAWAEMTAEARAFACALQEAFAGFLEHADAQVGRLLAYLEESGRLEDTIVILTADNGASQEGGPLGMSDSARLFQPQPDDLEEVQSRLHEIGGPRSSSNYPWGWAQAGNTPLKWYKQNTHGGGVRVPMIVHWPKGLAERGGVRHQFHHVSDVLPTVLETLGAEAPSSYRGRDQLPISGTSFAYALNDAAASTEKEAQYFEMFGHRGIWVDGWKAVAWHRAGREWNDDEWELYHLDDDFSESRNLAEEEPERLRALIDRWWIEAGRHGVLPLDDRRVELAQPIRRAGGPHESLRYRYTPPIGYLPHEVAPATDLGDWTLEAAITREADDEGVIAARGRIHGGFSLYIQGGELCFDYHAYGEGARIRSGARVPAGECVVGAAMSSEGASATGRVTLSIDGAVVAEGEVPLVVDRVLIGHGGTEFGRDGYSPVSDAYEPPFEFGGTIHRVEVVVDPWTEPSAAQEAARQRYRELVARQ